MSVAKYLKTMKIIQKHILDFLENEENDINYFFNLKDYFEKYKISDNKHIFKSLLHLIAKISNNHHRGPYFISKIEQILQFFKVSIKNYFSNSEIFNIFKSNKRNLLFLFDEKIIIIDEYIIKRFLTKKYIQKKYVEYFHPEIKSLIKEEWLSKHLCQYPKLYNNIAKELPDNFYAKRKTGESDNLVLEMIRNDSIEQFITYIEKYSYSLENAINNDSIYETNSFLLKYKMPKLIEYAVFYGSIQIFNYLRFNNVKLPQYLCTFAIHSKNSEIIYYFLEENGIKQKEQWQYKELLIESTKCHHNNIFEYIQDNYLNDKVDLMVYHLNYYNFEYIKNKFNSKLSFYIICKYDYYLLVKFSCKNHKLFFDQQTI